MRFTLHHPQKNIINVILKKKKYFFLYLQIFKKYSSTRT